MKLFDKNKKSESLAINKTIIFILIIFVIGLLLFFYYRESIWDYFKNLPGYNVNPKDQEVDYSKMTPDQLAKYGCVQIGKIVAGYIRLGGESNPGTKLYLEGQEIFIDFGKLNYWFGDRVSIGKRDNDVIKINPGFLDESSTNYLKYKDNLPSIAELKIINGTFILKPNLLCKNEEQIKEIDNQASCIENCLFYNGECKETGNNDEVSLGKINCKENQECFVKIYEEKLEDGDLRITGLDAYKIDIKEKRPIISLLNNQELKVITGKGYNLDFSIAYTKGLCFFIRTNKILLESGYRAGGKGSFASAIMWTQGDDKTFEIIGVDFSNNKKVLKRIRLNSEQTSKLYSEGKFISDKDFKKEVIAAKNGAILYVLENGRYNNLYTGDYKIEKKEENKIIIYRKYPAGEWYGKSYAEEWLAMDCNWWWFNDNINIQNLKDSLKETLIANKCKFPNR